MRFKFCFRSWNNFHYFLNKRTLDSFRNVSSSKLKPLNLILKLNETNLLKDLII